MRANRRIRSAARARRVYELTYLSCTGQFAAVTALKTTLTHGRDP
jgi:hypothetical protein